MFAVLDIESNGNGFRKEKIIEIAIFLYDGHRVIDQFFTLVNPEAHITPFVQKLTKITPKMVKTAPKFHEIAKRIVEITERATLVGHNVEFDYRMLRQSFRALGFDFQRDSIDTIPLAKKLIPNAGSYSLEKLCKSVGIPHSDVHRAVGDARATLELLKILISKDINNEILQGHQKETLSKSYQNKIAELTENLPSERGILYFQNQKGKIIFCDFADNLYKKAKKILNATSEKNKRIQREVEQIHYEFTGTDLIAELILTEKGIKNKKQYPFAVYWSDDEWQISSNYPNEKGLWKFQYLSQAEKFMQILHEKKFTEKSLKKEISFSKRNEIWVGEGRSRGEKSFLAFKEGKFIGYGFYEWHHQILSWEKIEKLMVPIASLSQHIKKSMQIAYLKGDLKVIKIE